SGLFPVVLRFFGGMVVLCFLLQGAFGHGVQDLADVTCPGAVRAQRGGCASGLGDDFTVWDELVDQERVVVLAEGRDPFTAVPGPRSHFVHYYAGDPESLVEVPAHGGDGA